VGSNLVAPVENFEKLIEFFTKFLTASATTRRLSYIRADSKDKGSNPLLCGLSKEPLKIGGASKSVTMIEVLKL
jgi:hypothetical protein